MMPFEKRRPALLKKMEASGHLWTKIEGTVTVDFIAHSHGNCNGPRCALCGYYFCEHCIDASFEVEKCSISKQCCATVATPGMNFYRPRPCKRPAVQLDPCGPVCRQHSIEGRAAQIVRRNAKQAEKAAIHRARFASRNPKKK